MDENWEFRINVEDASLYLPSDVGVNLGGLVRRVDVSPDDPLFGEIQRLQREFRAAGKYFFRFWNCRRHYSNEELSEAALLHIVSLTTFQPAGEECGTEYDDAGACPDCGAGARQTTPLFLKLDRIPSKSDVCTTIADEIVVSRRVVDLFRDSRFTGARFDPILSPNTRGSHASRDWYQLRVVSKGVDVDAQTVAGNQVFDEGPEVGGQCPRGDLYGLNLISELYLKAASYDGSDIVETKQFFGIGRGELRPRRDILLSQRVRAAFIKNEIKGYRLEIPHLV